MCILRGGQVYILAAFFVAATSGQTFDLGVQQVDPFCIGGDPWTVTAPVADKTLRFGVFQCKIPTTAGTYSVMLKFLEPNQTAIGARVFSVTANDVLVIDRLDLVAVAGPLVPYQRIIQVASIGGFIDLQFFAQVRSAVVSSIEIALAPKPFKVGPGLIWSDYAGEWMISVDPSMFVIAPVIASHPGGMIRIEFAGQSYIAVPAKPEWLSLPGWTTQ